ncbi:MAG: hypothetical protein GY832_16935, partial [Chloroflexi bacterium]|nr:hypothetical protein [Chloroflexota bacterium]
MHSPKRKNHRLYLTLALMGLLILFGWSKLAEARPPTAKQRLEQAWSIAADVGRFEYQTNVEQITRPTARLENAGRSPTRQQLRAEGWVNRPENAMQLRLWSSQTRGQGIELKVEGERAYGRTNDNDVWAEIPNPTDIFAPGGDPLGFLVAAENVRAGDGGQGLEGQELTLDDVLGNPQLANPNSQLPGSTSYTFDLSGPRYAAYVRDQFEADMRGRGELPPGLRLGLVRQYTDMTGYGEIWLDETGLPVRQTIHLEFPPQPGDYDWTAADITTTFSGWKQGSRGWNQGAVILAQLEENPKQLFSDPYSLLPTFYSLTPDLQSLLFNVGLSLLLFALALVAFTHRRSRYFYGGLAIALTVSMLVTPLLQSHQVYAFTTRQQAKQAEFEQQRATSQAAQDAQAKLLRSTYDPTVNPLAISNEQFTIHNSSAPLLPASYSLLSIPADCDLADLAADCDGDTLTNGTEITKLGTDPTRADTDGDFISDKTEVTGFSQGGHTWYLDPLNPDSNGDFVMDGSECPQRMDIDGDTGQINPDITPGVCTNTDSDSAPDVFDYDDDDDGVPDNVDLARLAKSAQFDSVGDDLEFNLTLTGNGEPIFVDFQIRPPNPDHLYQTSNVLDWPSNDTAGQVRRVFNNTFAETPGYKDTYRGDRGDMVLNPMLEFEISFDATNPSAGLPITPTMTSADISSYADLSWLDTEVLTQLGISVNEGENNTLMLWIPLTYVQDELAGDTRVAWQARMMYHPETSQTTLGDNQTVRLIWMIEALTDNCSPPAGEDYDEYCADKSNWTTSNSVIQTYYESFTLTGLTVREDHGLDVAIIAQPPGTGNANYDDQLWHMADSLQTALIKGELKEANNRFSVADIGTFTSTWGVAGLNITNLSYDTQLGLAEIAGGKSTTVLNNVYSGAGVGYSATLLFAGEETARLVTLGDTATQWGGNVLWPDLTSDLAWLNTSATLRWTPYIHKGAGVWDTLNLETYFDELGGDLSNVFSNSELDKLAPSETIDDYNTARAGAILLAQNYYMALHIGIGALVAVDDELTNSDPLADYSRGSDEPVTRIVSEMLADIQGYYGQISIIQNLTDATDNTSAAATALSATFAHSTWAILEAVGDVAQGNVSNVLSLTLQKLSDYYKTSLVDTTAFTNASSFVALASASLVSGMAQELGISYGIAKAAWGLFSVKFGLAAVSGTVAAAQASASAGIAAGTNVAANSVKYVWNSVTIWAVATFILTVTMVWTFYALGSYDNPLQRSAVLARTIASTIVAVIMLAITLIPVAGFLIAGVLGLVDGLAALICAAVGVKAGSAVDMWVCGGWTGAMTTAITYLIFDQYLLVDLDDNDRLDIALETPELIQQTDNPGPLVGNELAARATVTNTISMDKPSGKFTRQDINRLLPGRSIDRRLKEATFAYYLQNSKTDQHQSLGTDQLDWNNNTEVFDISLQKPFETAGINQPAPLQYLTEAFNIPYVECWTAVCNAGRYKASIHTYLGADFVMDVFPATFSEFINLTSIGDNSYRLSWDSQFPTLIDADGDGLRSQASGGPDPNDAAWDSDSDGLTDLWERNNSFDPSSPNADGDDLNDYWEAFYGTNPRLADSDGDGLTDGDELFHSRSRHPYERDTQAWTGGWGITYYNTDGQALTARVSASPLDYDSDDDTLSDEREQIYGYNPNLPSVLNVLTLNSDISDNVVQPGVTVNYTATIKNELDGRTLNGLLQAELPVDVVRSTEVMDTLQPLQSITMTGDVAVPVVAQSTPISLTLRAGVVVSSTIAVEDPPGPVFYLNSYDNDSDVDYSEYDDSGYNHTVACTESAFDCPDDDASSVVNAGFGFDEYQRLQVTGQNSLRLGSNDNTFSMMMWLNPQQGYSPNDLHFEEFGRTVLGNNFYNSPETAFPSLTLIKSSFGSSAKMMLHFGHGDGLGYCQASGGVLKFNRWQHVAVTFDGGQFSFYVDGVLQFTNSGENCAGQNLYPAKNFTIGQTDGVGLYFKLMVPKDANFDEGYLWSNDNDHYINEKFTFQSFHYMHDNPNNEPEMLWYPGEDVIHENQSDPLVYYNLENWAVSGKETLTYWACNMDDLSAGYPLGCLDSDSNSDEPLYYKKDGHKEFERTHTSTDATGEYIVKYKKDYKHNKWGGPFTYDLYNNAFMGKLDEIALYNTNLSATDVQDLYLSSLRVAYLTFDEPPGQDTFADATAYGTVATCTDPHCPDSGIPGRDNQALRFDGIDDYVEFPHPLDPAAQLFTAAAWFKVNDLATDHVILQQRDGSGTGRAWLRVLTDGQVQSYLGGSVLNSGLSNIVTPERWHHAAVAATGITLTLFLDGQLVAQDSRAVEAADGDLLIGIHQNLSSGFFDGLIDEIVVQRGAADANAVQSLMREAPLLNLHLDESLNTPTFVDDTPYGNDATCTGNACPAAGTKGQVREAITLDGINDELNVDLSSINLDKSNMTFSMWVRPEQARTGTQYLLDMGLLSLYMPSDTTQLAVSIRLDQYNTSCATTLNFNSGDATLNLNRWNHVAFSIDQKGILQYPLTLYLNGVQVAQKYATSSGSPCSSINVTPTFGSNVAANLDEIALFGSALRGSEVKALYDYQAAWFDQIYEHRIIIDTDDPQVSLGLNTSHLPLAETLLDIEAVDISSSIASVQVTLTEPGGGTSTVAAVPGDDPTTKAWFYTLAPTVVGQYTIDLLATDEAGNTGSGSSTVYVDGTPPAATLDSSLTAAPLQTTPPAGDGPSTLGLFGTIGDSGATPPAGVNGNT